MNTYLNKSEWSFLTNVSSPDFEENFELLIKKYIDLALNSEFNKKFTNKTNVNKLNELINKDDWIYKIELPKKTSNPKINEERFKEFCNLLNSIGLLEDFYKIYGIGTKQDRLLATCYIKLANKQKKEQENYNIKQQNTNITDINSNDNYAITLYLRKSTEAIIGLPFISGIIYKLPEIKPLETQNQ